MSLADSRKDADVWPAAQYEALEALPALAGALRTIVSAEERLGMDFEEDVSSRTREALFDSLVRKVSLKVAGSTNDYLVLSSTPRPGKKEHPALRAMGCYAPLFFRHSSVVAVTGDDRVVCLKDVSSESWHDAFPPLVCVCACIGLPSAAVVVFGSLDLVVVGDMGVSSLLGGLFGLGLALALAFFFGKKADPRYVEAPLDETHSPSLIASLLGDALTRRLSFWRSYRSSRARDMEGVSWKKALEECSRA